jgi:hypothetical protein
MECIGFLSPKNSWRNKLWAKNKHSTTKRKSKFSNLDYVHPNIKMFRQFNKRLICLFNKIEC